MTAKATLVWERCSDAIARKPKDWDGEMRKAVVGRTGITLFVQRKGKLFYWRAWPVV